MMSKLIDLTGRRIGHLTVIRRAGSYVPPGGFGITALWLCRCDCGTEKLVNGSCLRRGTTRSCGCRGKEKNVGRMKLNPVCLQGGCSDWCRVKDKAAFMALEGDALTTMSVIPIGGGHIAADLAYGLEIPLTREGAVRRKMIVRADPWA